MKSNQGIIDLQARNYQPYQEFPHPPAPTKARPDKSQRSPVRPFPLAELVRTSGSRTGAIAFRIGFGRRLA